MHTTFSVAVLADIHGNSWALDAVLADIGRRSVKHIVNLGDCLYGPLDPTGVAERLASLKISTVRGNQDRALLEPVAKIAPDSTFEFVQSSLTVAHRTWLASLPATLRLDEELFLCHGSPLSDEEYLLEEVRPEGVFLRSQAGLAAQISPLDCEVVLCAHSHVPQVVWAAGRVVVNPGSVGLPAYTDDLPFPHAMESGSPHARYALLTRGSSGSGWRVEQMAVPYDWSTTAEVARRHNRVDWAQWLVSGRASAV